METIHAYAPATTANLGSGFDSVGMALNLYNEVRFTVSKETSITIKGEGCDCLKSDGTNLVYRCVKTLFEIAGEVLPELKIDCVNKIPLARGLGSSAAAIVAALTGANALLPQNKRLSKDKILNLAVSIEGHPDNVAPSLFGGMVVSAVDEETVHSIRLDVTDDLSAVVAIPAFHLSTKQSRDVLPSEIKYRDAVFNVGRVALLVAAFQNRRYDLLKVAMEDKLHQPYRAPLVPGLYDIIGLCVNRGALGAAISGAGPTVIAFCKSEDNDTTENISNLMKKVFSDHNVKCLTAILKPANKGAYVDIIHG